MCATGGGAAWFGVYEATISYLLHVDSTKKTKEDLSALQLISAGALAGMCYNVAFFPADVIKSRMQVTTDPRLNFRYFAKELWRTEGIRGLYRGNCFV